MKTILYSRFIKREYRFKYKKTTSKCQNGSHLYKSSYILYVRDAAQRDM